jgi:ABC-2 type transport system permease protein
MRAFLAGARIQLRFFRAYPDGLIPFFTAPVFTVIFLMIFRHAGRADLTPYATIAPVFIALWWLALFNAGWSIQVERWNGTIEMLVAAPSSFAAVVLGRITTTTMIGVVSFGETWLVGRLFFGANVRIYHPWAFVATIAITLATMAGTSVAMSSLFVLTRNAVTFSNAASYPFYILGGILAPVSVLPGWIRPVSTIVFSRGAPTCCGRPCVRLRCTSSGSDSAWSRSWVRAALRSERGRCASFSPRSERTVNWGRCEELRFDPASHLVRARQRRERLLVDLVGEELALRPPGTDVLAGEFLRPDR